MRLATTLSSFMLLAAATPADSQDKARVVAPDLSKVTSRSAAKALATKGVLTKILFFPAELGGEDVKENVGYITLEASADRERIIAKLSKLRSEGRIDNLTVVPEYKGLSFVPSKIVFRTALGQKPGTFNPIIVIW